MIASAPHVLCVSAYNDPTAQWVAQAVASQGAQVVWLDPQAFPQAYDFTFHLNAPPSNSPFLKATGVADSLLSSLDAVTGVYFRSQATVNPPPDPDPASAQLAYWNLEAALGAFYRALQSATWVNPLHATLEQRYKPAHLGKLSALGIRVPFTTVTNDPLAVQQFYEATQGRCVFKPVRGWAHTTLLTPEHMGPDMKARLQYCPILLQELIEGQDHRIYVVGDEVYPVAIESTALDVRETPYAPRRLVSLRDVERSQFIHATRGLGMVFSAIDTRRTPDGEWVVFEANPSPVFVHDEQTTHIPIASGVARLLLGP